MGHDPVHGTTVQAAAYVRGPRSRAWRRREVDLLALMALKWFGYPPYPPVEQAAAEHNL